MIDKKMDSLAKNSIIIFTLNIIGSSMNYISQFFMGRFLSIEDFGTLNAVFSALPLMAVPATALSIFVTKKAAQHTDATQFNFQLSRLYRTISIVSIYVAIAAFLFFPFIIRILGIQSDLIVLLSLILLITSFFPPVLQGALGGLHLFILMGLLGIVIPVTKLLSVVLLSMFSLSGETQQSIVLCGTILGTIFTIFLGYFFLTCNGYSYRGYKITPKDIPSIFCSEYFGVVLMNFGLMFFMNADILIIRLLFGDSVAGQYSAVQIFARVAYFVSASIVTVLLPMVAAQSRNKEKSFAIVNKGLCYTLGISFILYIPLIAFGRPIIQMMMGEKFDVDWVYLVLACIITLGLSLNTIMANYMFGAGQIKFLVCIFLLCFGLLLPLVLLFRSNSVLILIVFAGIELISFFINYIFSNRKAAI